MGTDSDSRRGAALLERGSSVRWPEGFGTVLSDLGGDLVVVRGVDGVSFRVHRDQLEIDVDPSCDRWGFVVDAKFCALQRQAHPPTKTEMVEGAWTLCGKWISSRSSPTHGAVTCATCLERAQPRKKV
jgi:hypothetical protein